MANTSINKNTNISVFANWISVSDYVFASAHWILDIIAISIYIFNFIKFQIILDQRWTDMRYISKIIHILTKKWLKRKRQTSFFRNCSYKSLLLIFSSGKKLFEYCWYIIHIIISSEIVSGNVWKNGNQLVHEHKDILMRDSFQRGEFHINYIYRYKNIEMHS